MTKKANTELARTRAAAKALRQQSEPTEAVATVQPALLAVLADARAIVARELGLMKQVQQTGLPMSLGDAKKLQALVSSVAATQTIEKNVAPDTEALTDAELEAEIKKLGGGV